MRSLFRRIKSFHPFTWLVMLVVSAALVLIMVPGEESRCYENPATAWQRECREAWQQSFERHANEDADMRVYEHGWPMPCAARAIYTGDRFENLLILVEQQVSEAYTEKRAVSWTRRRSWPLDGEEWRIRWWAVIVDLALFRAVIALVIWSTERWLRRRGGLLRFRVVDLLVGMAVFGVLIGWYTANARQRQLELELSELFDLKVSPSPFHGGNYGRWRYEGPVWLRKLVGNAGNLQAFWRRTEADLRMNANWKDDICELSRFAQLEKVSIEGALTYDALAELKALPHLETLKLDSFGNSSIEEAMRWRFDPERDLVLGDDLVNLAPLEISELELWGKSLTIEQVANLLSKMPQLQKLTLVDTFIGDEGVVELRERFPKVLICHGQNPFDSSTVSEDPFVP